MPFKRLVFRVFTLLDGKRPLVLAVIGAAVALSLALSSRVGMEEDITAMLPVGDPAIDNLRETMRRFSSMNRMFVDVSVGAGHEDSLVKAADAMHAGLEGISGIRRVLYRFDEIGGPELYPFMLGIIPNIFTEEDAGLLEQRISPESIRTYLELARRQAAGPQGAALKHILPKDPIGMGQALLSRLAAAQAALGGGAIRDGRMTSADGRHVMTIIETDFPSSDAVRSEPLLREVFAIAASVKTAFARTKAEVAVTGGHRAALENGKMIRGDAVRTVLIGLLAMFATCAVAYRRKWPALLTFLPMLIGGAFALAVLSLLKNTLSAIAIGCGSIIAGISVDYAIHALYHLDNAGCDSRRQMAEIISEIAKPVVLGMLTTACAFLVMAFSSVPGHKQLGLFGALTVAFSALCSLLLLPMLIPVYRHDRPAQPLALTNLMARFFAFSRHYRRALAAAASAAAILAAFGVARLHFDGDLARFNGITKAAAADERLINSVWGDMMRMTGIVVEDKDGNAALEKAATLEKTLDSMMSAGSIPGYTSLAGLCPPVSEQKSNLERWRSFWNAGRAAALHADLAAIGAELGFRPDAFAPFLAAIESPPAPLTLEQWMESPLDPFVSQFVSLSADGAWIMSGARLPENADFKTLESAVREKLPDARILDKNALAERLAQTAKNDILKFAAFSYGVVVAALLLLTGSIAMVAAMLAPLSVGLLWTMGALGWAGMSLNIMNVIFVVFLAGVGVDYSLFLVTGKIEEFRGSKPLLPANGGSILLCALTTLCGFGALAFARHPALFSIGVTALAGMFFTASAAYAITPAVMDFFLNPIRRRLEAPAGRRPVDPARIAGIVAARYRFQGVFVEQYVFWKSKCDPLFAALDNVAPDKGLIVDAGCGYGLACFLLWESQPEREFLGIDHDREKIMIAQSAAAMRPCGAKFAEADMFTTDFPACACVLLSDSLHYWPPQAQDTLIAKAFSALLPGGMLALRDTFAEDAGYKTMAFWERFAVRIGFNKGGERLYYRTIEEIKTALAARGFRDITIVGKSGRGSNRLITATKP